MTTTDRTPKPCLHPVAQHEHGTYACYGLDKCRCYPCAAAQSAYEIARQKQHAYGRWDNLVDAGPVREHVLQLTAAGIGHKRVARLAGVGHNTVGQLLYGKPGCSPSRRIRKETAAALMAVRADTGLLAGGVNVPAIGTHRRVHALVALGWSQQKLADRLGMLRSNLGTMLRQDQITARTARVVAALYDELWQTPPPEAVHREKIAASRARGMACRNGWAPPMAWDDDSIDDPNAQPDTATRIANRKTKLPPVDELRWLLDTGESIAAIASRFGVSEDGVSKALGRTPAA